jgi:RNA polymerase sigma factor (sigma-70 family)
VDDEELTSWVAAAARGDVVAWNHLVDRFSRLVWAVARAHRLSDSDAADVSQVTWLRLVENLDRIQQPERLGAWLATTARRESLAVLRRGARNVAYADVHETERASPDDMPPDGPILLTEERSAVALAFTRLSEPCQRLLRVLMVDPPPRYDAVSEALAIPIGSIGPTRARCLEKLHREVQIAGI